MLNEDMKDYIAEKIGLHPDMTVLDVGCGTGAFTYYLARSCTNVTFTGLDSDPDFIVAAKRKIFGVTHSCSFTFLQGDATCLPFESDSFDAVVSHTFFNSMPQYRQALREMMRVCRKSGIIASMTAMDIAHVPTSGGIYPKNADYWKKDYDKLLEKVQTMYNRVVPLNDYLGGIPTAYIPNLFEEEHLHQVSAYPIGRFFSLSNYAISDKIKRRYIKLSYLSDIKRLASVYEEPEAKTMMTEKEVTYFYKLLEQKRDYLLTNLSDNHIWEWEGGASLLVTGQKPSSNDALMDAIFSIIQQESN